MFWPGEWCHFDPPWNVAPARLAPSDLKSIQVPRRSAAESLPVLILFSCCLKLRFLEETHFLWFGVAELLEASLLELSQRTALHRRRRAEPAVDEEGTGHIEHSAGASESGHT